MVVAIMIAVKLSMLDVRCSTLLVTTVGSIIVLLKSKIYILKCTNIKYSGYITLIL